ECWLVHHPIVCARLALPVLARLLGGERRRTGKAHLTLHRGFPRQLQLVPTRLLPPRSGRACSAARPERGSRCIGAGVFGRSPSTLRQASPNRLGSAFFSRLLIRCVR